MKNFVILSTQRSGTTWLKNLLDSHDEICCFGEMFLKKLDHELSYERFRRGSLSAYTQSLLTPDASMESYMQRLFGSTEKKFVGIKLMYGQINKSKSIKNYFFNENFRIVHLVRRNYLKIIVSQIRASESGVFHSSGSEKVVEKAIHIDTGKLIAQLDAFQKNVDYWNRVIGPLQSKVFYYEDVVAQFAADESLDLLDFLKVDARCGLKSQNKKLVALPLHKVIDNYQEVKSTLLNSRWSHLLNE